MAASATALRGYEAIEGEGVGALKGYEVMTLSLEGEGSHSTAQPAADRAGNNIKGFKDFYLKAKAKIWP